MARNGAELPPHKWSESNIRQTHRHEAELRPQGRHYVPETNDNTATSDLEYGYQTNPMEISDLNQMDGPEWELENNLNYENNQLQKRIKRHAGHSHEETRVAMNRNTERFIEKLFKQFSNSDHDTMNLVEFERMMAHLGLDRLIEDKHLSNVIHSDESSKTADSFVNHQPDTHSNETVSKSFLFIGHVNKFTNPQILI